MRYVEGTDLQALLERGGRRSRRTARLDLLAPVAGALDAAHAAGPRPPRREAGEHPRRVGARADPPEHVYLSDFGLTTLSADAGDSGPFTGTADYAAPELVTGGAVDHRVDVYALGCVFFECLTGRPPYPGDSVMAVLWGHVNDPVPAASERNSSASARRRRGARQGSREGAEGSLLLVPGPRRRSPPGSRRGGAVGAPRLEASSVQGARGRRGDRGRRRGGRRSRAESRVRHGCAGSTGGGACADRPGRRRDGEADRRRHESRRGRGRQSRRLGCVAGRRHPLARQLGDRGAHPRGRDRRSRRPRDRPQHGLCHLGGAAGLLGERHCLRCGLRDAARRVPAPCVLHSGGDGGRLGCGVSACAADQRVAPVPHRPARGGAVCVSPRDGERPAGDRDR